MSTRPTNEPARAGTASLATTAADALARAKGVLPWERLRRQREAIEALDAKLDHQSARLRALKQKLELQRAQLAHQDRRAAELKAELRARKLSARLREEADARRLVALGTKLQQSERLRPQEDVLRQTLEQRLPAARRAAVEPVAGERHERLLARSQSYRRSFDAGDRRLADVPHETVEIGGLTWHVPADERKPDSFADQVLRSRWLPLHEILASRELAVGAAMIDIGANIGTTSVTRAVLGDFTYVYAAEPEPANYACLTQNVIGNGLAGLVLPDRVALGAENGEASLAVSSLMANHELLADPSQADGAVRERIVTVPACRLDTWVEKLGIELDLVTFVKCDTQGWEGYVLAGAPEVRSRKHIAWQIEFWPRGLEAARFELDAIYELIGASFTHFIDLRGRSRGSRIRGTADLREALSYLEEGRFTELLLYNGSSRIDGA